MGGPLGLDRGARERHIRLRRQHPLLQRHERQQRSPLQKGYNLCSGLGSWNTKQGTVNGPRRAPLVHLGRADAHGREALGRGDSASERPGLSRRQREAVYDLGGRHLLDRAGRAVHPHTDRAGGRRRIQCDRLLRGHGGRRTHPQRRGGGWTTATQTESVQPGTLAKITVTPSAVSLGVGATQVFTASGADTYGNAETAGFSPTWSTTTGGTLSVKTGTSTQLTAPKTAVSKGSVTATEGGIQGSATVTVTATPVVKVSITAGASTKLGSRYQVPLTVKATGTTNPIAGATVQVSVYNSTCTGTAIASGSGKTGPSGTLVFNFTTPTSGSYCAKATVTAAGYSAGTATAGFVVTAAKEGAHRPGPAPHGWRWPGTHRPRGSPTGVPPPGASHGGREHRCELGRCAHRRARPSNGALWGPTVSSPRDEPDGVRVGMQDAHNPVVVQRADGRWELHCPDCEAVVGTTVPIGIDLPVESKDVAELLRENHVGRLAEAS